jgi:pimaricinolide synthase PimS1
VEADASFRELGFDSLAAVDLRNRLTAMTGLQLTLTVVFNYPSPAALATHLAQRLAPAEGGPVSLEDRLDGLGEVLASVPGGERRAHAAARLRALLALAEGAGPAVVGAEDDGGIDMATRIKTASAEELFELMETPGNGGDADAR